MRQLNTRTMPLQSKDQVRKLRPLMFYDARDTGHSMVRFDGREITQRMKAACDCEMVRYPWQPIAEKKK